MPELPELKVYSENIKKLIQRKKVLDIKVYNSSRLDTDIETIALGIKNLWYAPSFWSLDCNFPYRCLKSSIFIFVCQGFKCFSLTDQDT